MLSTKVVIFKAVKSIGKRLISYKKREFKEVSIKVPWGQVSGKWWEPYDARPILSLHGRMDNCGTFDRLIPMLSSNIGFLAIDLPGHGYSSKLPRGVLYNSSVHLLTIKCVMDYLKWPKISLMGHSMGAILSYVYSMLHNDIVDFTICLDGAKPMIPIDKNKIMVEQLATFIKYERQSSSYNEPPSYTYEELISKVSKPNNNSVLHENAKYLIERNVAPSKLHKGKFYFNRDPRLKSRDVVVFCQDELIHSAQFMKAPIFIAKAKQGSYYEVKENFYQVLDVIKRTSVDCDFNYVDGTHHMHLNNPESVAGLLIDFIRRNNVEDRSIGGIVNEIIVEKKNLQTECI